MELKSQRLEAEGYLEAVELIFERGWTDGLAVVPPTVEKVEEMIAYLGRGPQEEIGAVPPAGGIATIEKLAVNSVMAGCRPEYFPAVIAAVEAMLAPEHCLGGTQTTTHCNEPLIIVNGPIAKKLNVNSGEGVFGRGFRANGTIGRAIRLVLWNLGRNLPGEVDKSCFSHPGAWSYCIAENEEASPWEPLHVEKGLLKGTSAVTVFSCEAPHSVFSHGSAEEMLEALVSSMATLGSNNTYFMGQTLVVLSPPNAQQFAREGWSKKAIKRYLWGNTRLSVKERKKASEFCFSQFAHYAKQWFNLEDEEQMIPLVRTPEDIHIVVAGGNYFNAVCPGWGYMGGFAVTREIRLPKGGERK